MMLVVASSAKELQGIVESDRVKSVCVGVGKVQAAVETYSAILTYAPSFVIGIGSCGAIEDHLKVGDVVIPSKVVQYDIDLRRFGLSRGEVFTAEGKKTGWLATDRLPHRPFGIIDGRRVWEDVYLGSADRFLSPNDRMSHHFLVDEMHLAAVDMESHAMVAAAKRAQVPVAIIRVVSDTWFGDRAKSLPNFLKEASTLIDRIIRIGYMEPSEKSPTIL